MHWVSQTLSFLLTQEYSTKYIESIQLLQEVHAVFFISILFISIIRLKYGKNKHNLSITKAQILPKDQLKNEQNQAWAYKTLVVIVGIWKITFLSTTSGKKMNHPGTKLQKRSLVVLTFKHHFSIF